MAHSKEATSTGPTLRALVARVIHNDTCRRKLTKKFLVQAPREPFTHDGVKYSLSHLDEQVIAVVDADGVERRILVTFSDHCFTCEGNGDEDPTPKFDTTERQDGRFSIERYNLSLEIGKKIDLSALGTVWSGDKERFIVVRSGIGGLSVHYVLPFSLDPLKGLGVHLHMRIRSAHPRDQHPIATFGSVGFSTLVKLRIAGKHPPRLYDKRRKKPW